MKNKTKKEEQATTLPSIFKIQGNSREFMGTKVTQGNSNELKGTQVKPRELRRTQGNSNVL